MKAKQIYSLAPVLCLSALSLLFLGAQGTPTPPEPVPVPAAKPHPLVWDAMEKVYHAKVGETNAPYSFWVTNTSKVPVLISAVNPSCGCTVADYPKPWHLKPGEFGEVKASMNIAGKSGMMSKIMTVVSSGGPQQALTMKVTIQADTDIERRRRNMELAAKDRQAVFKNDCAACHVEPLKGKLGKALFDAGCNICHAPPEGQRADIVPDLTKIAYPTTKEWWKKIISEGKEKTLMPGFAKAHGGPLTEEEIESLAEYAVNAFRFDPAPLKGKLGKDLFDASCNICHEPASGFRAAIVPDLKKLAFPTTKAYWKKIISDGKPNTLMPGFAKAHGGPLTDEEIESLADYAVKAFPFDPANAKKPATN